MNTTTRGYLPPTAGKTNFLFLKLTSGNNAKTVFAFVLTSVLLLMACNNPATTTDKKDADTTAVVTNSDTSSMPTYDPAMDPLTVGVKFSKLLHDSLGIKLYEFTMKPGDSAALHKHPDHAVYVLQGGKLSISINGGTEQPMELKTGMGFIGPAFSDAGKNIGNTTIKLLVADIYRPRGNDTSPLFTYDAALDPITVAGASAKKLHDTLNIKIFEGTLKPGQSFPLHAHPDHAIYILHGGKMEFTPKGAETIKFEVKTGEGWITGPITDSAKNIGNTTIRALEIDVYRPRGK